MVKKEKKEKKKWAKNIIIKKRIRTAHFLKKKK